jgi:transcriptional regulator with XRE-family HTH domain
MPTMPALLTLEPLPLPTCRRLRGILAEARVSHSAFARACGLSREYVGRILNGYAAGELARIKLRRGLVALGLDREVRHA